MDLSKIFDKSMEGGGGEGGDHSLILLHFYKLRQHVFFLFQNLEVIPSENLSASQVFQLDLL